MDPTQIRAAFPQRLTSGVARTASHTQDEQPSTRRARRRQERHQAIHGLRVDFLHDLARFFEKLLCECHLLLGKLPGF